MVMFIGNDVLNPIWVKPILCHTVSWSKLDCVPIFRDGHTITNSELYWPTEGCPLGDGRPYPINLLIETCLPWSPKKTLVTLISHVKPLFFFRGDPGVNVYLWFTCGKPMGFPEKNDNNSLRQLDPDPRGAVWRHPFSQIQVWHSHFWGFPKMEIPKNGWFM